MAASLVAAIHEGSDTPVTLVGGHNGIYEVAVDGETIYTNQGTCAAGFPSDAEIVGQIAERLGFEPAQVSSAAAADCCGPAVPAVEEPTASTCCEPAQAEPANSSSCC